MARKPQDAVQFTLESAERIADVVRAAELATPQGKPLTFETQAAAQVLPQIKLARYTATTTWLKNTARPIAFATHGTSGIFVTGVTATAFNRFAIIPGHTGAGVNTTQGVLVSVQKIGGLYTVLNAEV